MPDRYTKTDVGRAEIRARVHALSRTARNLLLIIDPSKEGAEWVRLVQGASAADLQTLLDAGLVAPAGAAPAARPAVAPVATAAAQPALASAPAAAHAAAQALPTGAPLAAATAVPDGAPTAASAAAASALSYSDLYDLLPSLAKQHLGLIKGYRFALAIERAEGLPGLQKLARELVGEVESSKGPAVSQSVRRALLLP
jgi:hypothetical protein